MVIVASGRGAEPIFAQNMASQAYPPPAGMQAVRALQERCTDAP